MDITQADFWDVPNEQGLPTFSYAQLLAQLQQDIGGVSPNVGLGAIGQSSGQSIANLLITPLVYSAIEYDDLGFLDVSSGSPRDERFIIPDVDPPIERVIFGGQWQWQNNAGGDIRGGDTRLNFNGPGGNNPAGAVFFSQNTSDPAFNNRLTMNTGAAKVVAGDIWTLNVFQDSGGNVNITDSRVWIYVIK